MVSCSDRLQEVAREQKIVAFSILIIVKLKSGQALDILEIRA